MAPPLLLFAAAVAGVLVAGIFLGVLFAAVFVGVQVSAYKINPPP
jgi:hypothetical protein